MEKQGEIAPSTHRFTPTPFAHTEIASIQGTNSAAEKSRACRDLGFKERENAEEPWPGTKRGLYCGWWRESPIKARDLFTLLQGRGHLLCMRQEGEERPGDASVGSGPGARFGSESSLPPRPAVAVSRNVAWCGRAQIHPAACPGPKTRGFHSPCPALAGATAPQARQGASGLAGYPKEPGIEPRHPQPRIPPQPAPICLTLLPADMETAAIRPRGHRAAVCRANA